MTAEATAAIKGQTPWTRRLVATSAAAAGADMDASQEQTLTFIDNPEEDDS